MIIIKADLEYTGIHTPESESYKQAEPRDGGKKVYLAKSTDSSQAPSARD